MANTALASSNWPTESGLWRGGVQLDEAVACSSGLTGGPVQQASVTRVTRE